jgi:hypothetical protein
VVNVTRCRISLAVLGSSNALFQRSLEEKYSVKPGLSSTYRNFVTVILSTR